MTTGTDWFEPQHDRELPHTHQELVLLVERAGFTPMEALVAATRHGAEAMGLPDAIGTVAVGKQADLLVLDADPLADIRNTQHIRMTIRRDRPSSRPRRIDIGGAEMPIPSGTGVRTQRCGCPPRCPRRPDTMLSASTPAEKAIAKYR